MSNSDETVTFSENSKNYTISKVNFNLCYVTSYELIENSNTIQDSYPTTWLMANYTRCNYYHLSN